MTKAEINKRLEEILYDYLNDLRAFGLYNNTPSPISQLKSLMSEMMEEIIGEDEPEQYCGISSMMQVKYASPDQIAHNELRKEQRTKCKELLD